MTRQDITNFYGNKIDDIADETKREELLEKLDEIDTMLLELEIDIGKELEYQKNQIEDEIQDNYELYVRTIRGDV